MTAVTGPYSIAPDPANPLIGRGKIYLDRLDSSGNRTGLLDLGNCSLFEVEDKVEKKEKYESMDAASNLYAIAVTRQTFTIKITGDEVTLDNICNALNGSVVQVTATGNTVTSRTITPSSGLVLGRLYDLGNRNITALTGLHSGSTALTAGTDYTVDTVNGLVKILPTSTNATPGDALTADFTFDDYTYNAAAVGAVSSVNAYVLFIGDPVKGRKFKHEYWNVMFTPTGNLGFIKDDFLDFGLEGQVIADTANHPTSPIGLITQIA